MTLPKLILRPLLGAALVLLGAGLARADGAITLELNKLEPADQACRVYMVFSNGTGSAIESYKPDLVFFDREGVIADRLVVEGGPLPAGKTRVKLFDVSKLGCGDIQRVLLNDLRTCAGQEAKACLEVTRTSSRNAVEFIK